ncbi:uncharacterized protein LOC122266720 [Penaeus japonicus]|uniref:uncharacterized protein LOC122266720 n=1 Tax=Penaeus japonicus TaxID=27405 RepID=UPI001C71101B|nr:uncharacterized protein LOC122266720 [Penaeus japonicus]
MTRKQAHITTAVKDVDLVIEAKTKGWQMILDIALAIGMQQTEHTLWFGVQYVNKKGHRKWIKDNRYVLDHRLDKRKKPLQFALRVKVFPEIFSKVDDRIAQVLIYRQLREHIEKGELNCPQDKIEVLTKLAEDDNIEGYMNAARNLEEYGKMYFKLTRADGARVDLTVNHSGITVSCRNENSAITFEEIQVTKTGKTSVCITKAGQASKAIKYKTEKPRSCKKVVEAIESYLEVYRQTRNVHEGSVSKDNETMYSSDTVPEGEAMVREDSSLERPEEVEVTLNDSSEHTGYRVDVP